MGSPPGYVGYGEGGVLTEAVRRRPYSVVLLDEIEKAHPGVQDIFYQVFDKGNLRDGEGRDIDFKNTVIMMTSNAGSDLMMSMCSDPATCPNAEQLREAIHPELLKVFKPAFLGRINVVPYFPLSDEVLKRIVVLQLNRIGRRVESTYRATFQYSPELVSAVAARCTEVDTGRGISTIFCRTASCPSCPSSSWPAWPKAIPSSRSASRCRPRATSSIASSRCRRPRPARLDGE